MGTWVCREKAQWRDKLWLEGETFETVGKQKWVFSHGWWVVDGKKVIDQDLQEAIPGGFEPTDLGELVNPKQVYNARNHATVARDWVFKSELEKPTIETDIEKMPDPEPMTPEKAKAAIEPPSIPTKRGRKAVKHGS